jgi:hypothetical protein
LQSTSALQEKLDSGIVTHQVGHSVDNGQWKRFDRKESFPCHTQRRAAGGQDLQGWTLAQQPAHQISHPGRKVLAVVENQQELALAQHRNQRWNRHRVLFGRSELLDDRAGYLPWIGQRRKFSPASAVNKRTAHLVRDRKGDPRLADATWTSQRQEWSRIVS